MGNNIVVWKGTTDVIDAEGTGEIQVTKDGFVYTRIYEGPYNTIIGQIPARLSNVQGVPNVFFVDTVRVTNERGGKGKMVVTLTPAPEPDYTFPDGAPEIEIDWVAVSKPVITAPVFVAAGADNAGARAGQYFLSDDDKKTIRAWEAAEPGYGDSDSGLDKNGNPTQQAIYDAAPGNVTTYLDLIIAGVDSYNIYAPVIRRTTKFASPPTVEACGMIDDPPVTIAGYVFLKTADRCRRTKAWVREEEWTGADNILDVLYEYSPG